MACALQAGAPMLLRLPWIGFALAATPLPVPAPVRHEKELVDALGEPLLAARPASGPALRTLSHQLLVHWFAEGRRLLPVVSAAIDRERPRAAAELARRFAAMGVRTLLVDGNLRSPRLHRELGIAGRSGLADILAGRPAEPAALNEHLAVLAAGATGRDPLALLGDARLRDFLAAAARRFRVLIVDAPAAAEGPDLQIYAALAGGALVVHGRGGERRRLIALRRQLDTARARVVSVLVSG